MRILARVLLIALFSFTTFFASVTSVHAAISSTTATIDTTTMTKNASIQMWFSIQNTDSQAISYIKITRPSTAVTIVGGGTSWSMDQNESTIILTGRTLNPGVNLDVQVDVNSGSAEMPATPWIVQVSDNVNGSNLYTATGSLAFSVSGEAPDNTAPNIANVSLSTTNSSFTVSWSTDEATNGSISYGTTNSYGSSKDVTSFSKNHSIAITGLSQDTLYYFRIDSADASGNSANSYDSFLVTSDIQPTATPTVTPTTTPTPGATPTPTPVPDKTEPLLVVHEVPTVSYRNHPNIKVTVSDLSGISTVSYSVNGGPYLRIPGIGTNSSTPIEFSFAPKHATASGTYTVKVKASDTVGNTAISDPVRYSLDWTGPSIFLSTTFKPVMSKMPALIGTVLDASGIQAIEYSLDRQRTWKRLASIVTERGIEFNTELPNADREGIYTIILRAIDSVGNISTTKEFTFAVDRIAPRAGMVAVKSGSIVLTPDSSTGLSGYTSRSYTLYIPTVGGVMNGELLAKTSDGAISSRVQLSPSFRSGMWEAVFSPEKTADYELSVILDDTVRDEVMIPLFTFHVKQPSCIVNEFKTNIQDAKVTLYAYDAFQKIFLPWKAEGFGEINPIQSPCYSYILPKGTYRLEAKGAGYSTANSAAFNISKSAFVSEMVQLKPSHCYTLLWFSFCLPGYSQFQVYPNGTTENIVSDEHILVSVPERLNTLRELIHEKEATILMMNSWLPDSMGMVMRLSAVSKETNMPLIIVMPYESDSFVQSWRGEAQITVPVVSDPDGQLIMALDRHVGPFVAHTSKDGFIQSLNVHMEQMVQKGIQ